MRTMVRVGLSAALVLAAMYGCREEGAEQDQDGLGESPDVGAGADAGAGDPDDDDDDRADGGAGDGGDPDDDDDDRADGGTGNGGSDSGQDGGGPGDAGADAGDEPTPNRPDPPVPPDPPGPTPTPRTEVPDELVGAWESSPIDFALWEDYREGHYAGRDAVPTREAMIFHENGDAKFYRYERAFTLYEELIDCEGTVAFHGDGTFTFYPVTGRKRFYDSRHAENTTDRALTAAELIDPELAGTRAYTYLADSIPAAVRITVPSSAPYNWYKKE